MAQRPLIDILLPTWNGAAFLSAQLDSLLRQQDVATRILVRDDGSADGTWDLVRRFAERHGRILPLAGPRLGVVGNVGALLSRSDAEGTAGYFALCDQDDVWFKDKLSLFLNEFNKSEDSDDLPLLVFSDQIPTDSKLTPLSNSLMKYQKQNPYITNYRELVFQNVVTGGAMAINRALCEKALECTDRGMVLMHDHWMAIVASCFGKCIYIDMPTSYYRQHARNEVGAKKVGSKDYILKKLISLPSVRDSIVKSKMQAEVFLQTYGEQLNCEETSFLKAYSRSHSGLFFYFKNRKRINGIFRLLGKCVLG